MLPDPVANDALAAAFAFLADTDALILDLRDAHLRLAKQRGVKVVISTDAHSTHTASSHGIRRANCAARPARTSRRHQHVTLRRIPRRPPPQTRRYKASEGDPSAQPIPPTEEFTFGASLDQDDAFEHAAGGAPRCAQGERAAPSSSLPASEQAG